MVVGEFQRQSYFPTNAGARSAPYEFVHRARSFEVMPKASLLLTARSRGVAQSKLSPLGKAWVSALSLYNKSTSKKEVLFIIDQLKIYHR